MKIRRELTDYPAEKIFFTSDEHYFHRGSIKHCSRPFSDVEDMNSSLIRNFNEVVSHDSIVFHLGDLLYADKGNVRDQHRAQQIVSQLNGKHVLVLGNHDITLASCNEFSVTLPYLELLIGKQLLCLCHYPMESWNGRRLGSIMLHGHSHGNSLEVQNRFDVGVDCNAFRPISYSELLLKKSV